MIKIIYGEPGSGKSLFCNQMIQKYLKAKRMVFTNFSRLECYQFTKDELETLRFPRGSVIVIDEPQRWYNTRQSSKFPAKLISFITLHRHFDYTLIVISQRIMTIDVNFRMNSINFYQMRQTLLLPYLKLKLKGGDWGDFKKLNTWLMLPLLMLKNIRFCGFPLMISWRHYRDLQDLNATADDNKVKFKRHYTIVKWWLLKKYDTKEFASYFLAKQEIELRRW